MCLRVCLSEDLCVYVGECFCMSKCVCEFFGCKSEECDKGKMSKYSLLLALHPRNRLDPIFLCLHKCMSVCKSLCHSCIYDLCLSVF